MKRFFFVNPFLAGLCLMLSGNVMSQSFTTLHSFSVLAINPITNYDGAIPMGALVKSGDSLFGTATQGGSAGNGTLFRINTDGTGFTNLHTFTAFYYSSWNNDGAGPAADLIVSDNTLYGTAVAGGSSGQGTVFKINTNGTGFTTLYSFTELDFHGNNLDGAAPVGGLILASNTLYGTASDGGSLGRGTIFRINTDGTDFTNLYTFDWDSGAKPVAGLTLSGDTLYGTTKDGGSSGFGTVFKINTNGTDFVSLHQFSGEDGATPEGRLVLAGNTLYGTASGDGGSGYGSVFAINTDGTGFTNLYVFSEYFTNGAYPRAGLILSANALCGTTADGGTWLLGTVFKVLTNGAGFSTLHHFIPTSDSDPFTNNQGGFPYGGVIVSDNTLYGTAAGGGKSGNGTVFSISFAPQLTIVPSGTNVILSWPVNNSGFDYAGYILQSTTNLVPPIWSTVSPTPIVVNDRYTVTNSISGTQRFYRLSL